METTLLTIPTLADNQDIGFVQFTNTARRTEKDSHYFGSVKIKDEWHRVNTWIKTASNGKQFLSTSFSLMNAEQAAQAEARDQQYSGGAAITVPKVSVPAGNPLHAEIEEGKTIDEAATSRAKIDLGLTAAQCVALGISNGDPRHPDYDADIPF